VAQFLALRAIPLPKDMLPGTLSVRILPERRPHRRRDGVGPELALRTGVSGPAVSQLLTGRVDAGLLERRELVDDRRRQALSLSGSGERALASATALLRERLSSLLGELPRPEADALARALPRVEATLSGAPPPRRRRRPAPPPPPDRGGGPHRRR